MTERTAVVLGAGLQGTLTALALAEAGYTITLIDGAPDCLLRASLKNEGKIHLGFVYAHDRSRRTAALMLDAALAFGPLLERWLGRPLPWASLATGPFSYAVLDESLVPPADLMSAWDGIQADYDARAAGGSPSYLGASPSRLWWHPQPADRRRDWLSDRVRLVVDTAERAVNLVVLRDLVRARLAAVPAITCQFCRRVTIVGRTPNGFVVEGTLPTGERWRHHAPVVVNCLWEGRLAIDREMGLTPSRPWVYRLKYRLMVRLPVSMAGVPSLTMMLGRFGDIVNYGDGRAYLSWYPTCLAGWSSDVTVPAAWDGPCQDGVPLSEARELVDRTLLAFDEIVPGLRECTVESVAAGVIFSWGATDIDDLASELHRRDDIGPSAHDGYITVNTGKLTSAPLFARAVVDLLR